MTAPGTPLDLEGLARAATPGPWRTRVKVVAYHISPPPSGDSYGTELLIGRSAYFLPHKDDPVVPSPHTYPATPTVPPPGYVNPDAAYIAAASPDVVLTLLEENRRLTAALDLAAPFLHVHGWVWPPESLP